MESRAKLLGHAIHPMLIVFPLGLLSTALIFDILYYPTDNDALGTAAFFMIAAGIIGGLAAAAFGLWDWLQIPEGTRAKQIGLVHGGGNVAVVLLFLISWLLRLRTENHAANPFGFVLEIIAVGTALVAAWLGGELVQQLGVGVNPGANLDAPSSLTGASTESGVAQPPRPA
jgi:uncharacterized membrane protein